MGTQFDICAALGVDLNLEKLKKEALELIERSEYGITTGHLVCRLDGSLEDGLKAIKALVDEYKIVRDGMRRWKIAPTMSVVRESLPKSPVHKRNKKDSDQLKRQSEALLLAGGMMRRQEITNGVNCWSISSIDAALYRLKLSGIALNPKLGWWCHKNYEQTPPWTDDDLQRLMAR